MTESDVYEFGRGFFEWLVRSEKSDRKGEVVGDSAKREAKAGADDVEDCI